MLNVDIVKTKTVAKSLAVAGHKGDYEGFVKTLKGLQVNTSEDNFRAFCALVDWTGYLQALSNNIAYSFEPSKEEIQAFKKELDEVYHLFLIASKDTLIAYSYTCSGLSLKQILSYKEEWSEKAFGDFLEDLGDHFFLEPKPVLTEEQKSLDWERAVFNAKYTTEEIHNMALREEVRRSTPIDDCPF